MAYTYDSLFAVDPNSPSNVARNASILLFDPNDATKTAVTLTDVTDSPLANPIITNQHGFGPAFKHATLDRLAWEGAGMSGVFTSYEGMKAEATAARAAAETAAADAAAAAEAELTARIAAGEFVGEKGADGSNVLPTDTAIKNAIENTGSATRGALNATYASTARLRGLAPVPLAGVTVTPLGTATRPFELIGETLWGADGSTLRKSTDDGLTWTAHGTLPAGFPIRLLPTTGGEMLLMTDKYVYRSSGFANGTQTWALKVTANGACQFQGWSIDGDGTRFLTTEYAAGTGFADSRYARMTLDGGNTWNVVYDSVARYGATAADGSHLHGCAYDKWADRWYISEGHSNTGDIGGIYCSTDNGATWTRAEGMKQNPAPTVIIATDDGLVCASDNAEGGIYGVVRADVATQQLRRVWAWRPGITGTLGFGVHGHRDPETGIVYMGYRTEKAELAPFIVGGTPTTGSRIYTWPNAFSAYDDFRGVWALGGGKILALAGISQVLSVIRGTTAVQTIPHASTGDTGNVLGGTAEGSSTALSPRATTGTAIRSLAAGVSADTSTAVQDGTAVGNLSSATGDGGTAVGATARAHGTGVAVGTGATTGAFTESTAVGYGAVTTSSAAVSVGRLATAGNAAVAVGRGANGGTAGGGSAFGYGALATGGANSTALGAQSTTTRAFQTAIGPRSLLIGNSATVPTVNPTAGGELYVEGGALKFRGSAGTVTVIAPA